MANLFGMYNFLDKIKDNPTYYKQLSINDQLVTQFNCPLDVKFQKMWSDKSYFVYIIEGKKVWHTPTKSFELTEGKCIFVKKGAHIVEQFFNDRFCVVMFFVSDQFIADTIRSFQPTPTDGNTKLSNAGTASFVETNDSLHAFFSSVIPYFLENKVVNKDLLELKFKELILNVISNPNNREVNHHFYSLLTDSLSDTIIKIMEENFSFNLSMDVYARMCGMSLSTFKREFKKHSKTTPGRWLLERRLKHAQIIINTSEKTVSEIAYESGFENVSHFSRVFKDRFGESPANFRLN